MTSLSLPELTELKSEKKLDNFISDLYEIDGYLGGAISRDKSALIKEGIKFMQELLKKIKKLKTQNDRKEEVIKYIQTSIKIGESKLGALCQNE